MYGLSPMNKSLKQRRSSPKRPRGSAGIKGPLQHLSHERVTDFLHPKDG